MSEHCIMFYRGQDVIRDEAQLLGVRVVISGNQLRETARRAPDRDLFVSPDYYEYQPAGW